MRRLKKVKEAYFVPSCTLTGCNCVRRNNVAEMMPMTATLSKSVAVKTKNPI